MHTFNMPEVCIWIYSRRRMTPKVYDTPSRNLHVSGRGRTPTPSVQCTSMHELRHLQTPGMVGQKVC